MSPGTAGMALSRPRRPIPVAVIVPAAFFLALILLRHFLGEGGLATDFGNMEAPPSSGHPFGTDTLGRDMLTRTVRGIAVSLKIGLFAAVVSAAIALVLGLAAGTLGRWADLAVSWLVDVAMAMPHLVLLILISFAAGGGERGVTLAVALSHWPALTRVIRAEALQLREAPYVALSRKFGKGAVHIAVHHFLPHLFPQLLVGLLLLFPHAILHESALSFLGFGLPPHTPAVGILLAESLRHLSTGSWWLGFFPGLFLLATVKMVDVLGHAAKRHFYPDRD